MIPRTLACAIVVSTFGALVSVGCNGLLGNEEGTLRLAIEAGAPTSDAGAGSEACDTAQGNKVCFGLCVKIDQTNTGCGESSCEACDPKNVVSTVCKGAATTLACGFDACKAGFDDCDKQLANGCETSLNAKANCGACGKRCVVPTPYCAQAIESYECVATCPLNTENCGDSCVNTNRDIEHCGGCDRRCARQAATATCERGECTYVCNAGTHACDDICASVVDPKHCGDGCIRCPSPGANVVPTCSNGICGTACAPGFLDCDGVALNGCETSANPGCKAVLSCTPGGNECPVKTTCCNGKCIDDKLACPGGPDLPPPLPHQ